MQPILDSSLHFLNLLRSQSEELNLPPWDRIPDSHQWVKKNARFAYREGDALYIQSNVVLASGAEKIVYSGQKFDLEVDETTEHLGSEEVVFIFPREPGIWKNREFGLSKGSDSPHLVQTIAHAQFGKNEGRTGVAIQNRFLTLGEHLRDSAATINDVALRALLGDYQQGLGALHSLDYVHKDIKADNLFVSFDTPPIGMVGDFGCAARLSKGLSPAEGMRLTSYSPHLLMKATTLYRTLSTSSDCTDLERSLAASTLATITDLKRERGLSDPETPPPEPSKKEIAEELLPFLPADDFYALGVTFEDVIKKLGEERFPITAAAIDALKRGEVTLPPFTDLA
ncbi:MAG: hypothetical protein KBC64_03370 [Simkaniaceae bacterium]|nr:hypothetical protein [Simkaniaceae bacterium]